MFMKLKLLLLILFSLWGLGGYSQKELWGVNKGADDGDPNSTGYKGNITKYDINGQNPVIMHEFTDFTTGKTPKGKLFLASNGKLYGKTIAGGNAPNNWENGYGILFEYDLVLNKYRVLYNFNSASGMTQYIGNGLIEPIIGKLYGSVGNKIFSFDLNTDVFTLLSGDVGVANVIDGELMKASNGMVYGTSIYNYCPNSSATGQYNFGTIFKVNTTTNILQVVNVFDCAGAGGGGMMPTGGLIEAQPGKLYGTGGSAYSSDYGSIFEYNFLTNTKTLKQIFDGNNLGSNPKPMVNSGNGKLYGVCTYGGVNPASPNPTSPFDYAGTLFEYDYTANTITKIHDFGHEQSVYPFYQIDGYRPISIMKASTNNYFGISGFGTYIFNPIANSVLLAIDPTDPNSCPTCVANSSVTESLIEICRKPSYHEFSPDTFSKEVGESFTYNIQNTNATTYVWKKDATVLPTQTTAILNIPNVAITDNGTYTCTMTNECGTTITMPLYLNVTNLGNEENTYLENKIKIYPNPTKNILNIKLTENNNIKISQITITNLLGQTVFNEEKESKTIDVSKLATGIYHITIKTDQGNWSTKFIKE